MTAHSIWATVYLQFMAGPFHQALLHGEPMAILFLVVQVALVAGYVWLLAECIAEIRLARRHPKADLLPS